MGMVKLVMELVGWRAAACGVALALGGAVVADPPPFEVGTVEVGGVRTTVELVGEYASPVVVCTVHVVNNTRPVVARVDAAGSGSFDVWLQNPGDLHGVVADTVHYIVMEEGAWDIGGWEMEARRYTSTRTDRKGSWVGESRSYLQTYTTPVVVGQVMSANDAGWSVFWCRGGNQGSPPNSGTLFTGKHVGEDADRTREDELVGYIVFEAGDGVTGVGIAEALRFADTVLGVGNSPPYSAALGAGFDDAPEVVIASINAMDGGDGAWAALYGAPHAAADEAWVTADEDQISDNERSHTNEQLAVLAFARRSGLFADISSLAGFDVQTGDDPDRGSGLSFVDLDNNGYLDAVITGSAQSRVLMNADGAAFSPELLHNGGMERQAALFDVDDDGLVDVWGIPGWPDAGLMRNVAGTLAFAGDAGVYEVESPEGAAAADLDGDGLCDVMVFAENGNWAALNAWDEDEGVALEASRDPGLGFNDAGDVGNGHFVSSGDVNNDGWVDFFYHYSGGKLFVSTGDGAWTQRNFGIWITHGAGDKFGSAWGDYDNDGDLDLYVASVDPGRAGTLWRNDVDWESGGGAFVEVAGTAGLDFTDAARGCAWGDYDNDGWLDLYVATEGASAENLLFRNLGDGTFARVEDATAQGDAQDVCFVDIDNDGDLDIAVTQEDASNTLLRNGTDDDRYLKVRILGAGERRTNRAAIGVRVELRSEDGSALLARRDIGVARGFGGTEPLWLHFGGVDPAATYTLRVHFQDFTYDAQVVPGGATTMIGATVIPQMVTLDEALIAPAPRIVRWREVAPIE